MAITLTNDDGIDAPGLMALQEAVAQVTDEPVWVIAPDSHLSGCGHQVTTHKPLKIEERAEGQIAVSGTPADCTRLALTHLCPEASWLLSGINFGGNLGVDEYISGTVAAVREAAILGVRAIAFSQYRDRRLPPPDWQVSRRYAVAVLRELMARPLERGCFWNVNFPHIPVEAGVAEILLPEMVFCSASQQPLPTEFERQGNEFTYVGNYSGRERVAGDDVDVCFSGQIAISQRRV
ncbi:5'/3'-nucleotidase SurE [Sodalinema gerasimenkoae]|uniref:5'/3'-nucleotidase SurE n=1 Tax=Sodalinema gerasimenkoae TaxID=2862348 RepID=UPI00135C7899|nr:5'/3'-nucleotidase SurE [Sodalinema gerasimenkoae]